MSVGSIDERIVEMTFKGQAFADGVRNTISALSALKERLTGLKGSEAELNNIDEAGKRFSLAGVANGLETLTSKFGLLGITGITVLSNIVNRAVNAGISIAKSLTIDPIKQGLEVYETKINAIQTILANTSSSGTTLNQVTQALNQLNVYANQTVYNFGQMAQNIGTFTAAGVNLKTSVASIKGIANLAALSGSSAEQASTAMYQLSQAIAAGSVKLQDWNSVVNAGLGGKVFQNALIQTAKATGVNIDAIIKKAGSFRNSLQKGWLTSKILTQTLETFTGDLTAQQLKSLGYSKQQIPLILAQAKAAQDSATKIRTVTQLQAALREEVATAWSTVWQSLLGNINQATDLLSAVHNTLETLFTKPVYDFNRLLTQWDKLGGRDQIIQAISESFGILGKVLKTIGSAFREVFPPVTAQTLIAMGVALDNFVAKLEPSKKTLGELRAVFVGVFSVVKIVVDVIGALISSLFSIGSIAASTGTGILALGARFGIFLSKLEKTISSSKGLRNFFDVMTIDLRNTVRGISFVVSALTSAGPVFSKLANAAKPIVTKIADAFSKLGSAISKAIVSGNFETVIQTLNALLVTKVLLVIKNFFLKFGASAGSGGGLLHTLKESFESLTGALQNMQTALKAKTLEEIATAVGILTISMFALSSLKVADLTRSLTAITVMMTQLITALAIVSKVAGSAGILKMAAIGVALNLLATAIVVLSGAVLILSRLSWAQLEKGLAAVAILLTELVTATLVMSANTKGLVASAYSLQVMAVALNILSVAVKTLGAMNIASLAKGIGSVAALLLLMVAFQALSGGGKNLITTAAAMLLIGAAINVMAIAIESLGKLSIATLVKGIVSLAAVLAILVVAMNVMEGSILGAAALVIAAASILILANALNSLGGMSWVGIAKALVLLAGALTLLAAASIVMEASLPGAAALLVMAAALAILTPVLVAFSQLSWEGIAKALVTLAGAFVVIAAAGVILAPLVVVLLGLGAAVLLIGTGIITAGAGIAILAAGLGLLAAALAAAGVAIQTFIVSILSVLPQAITQVSNIIFALAAGITKAGPAILIAITAVLLALLGAISAVIPKATVVFGQVLLAILGAIGKYSPRIVATFLGLILTILTAVANYYPKFVLMGVTLIINLLNGIARQIPKIAAAAVGVVIAFINAIASSELKIAQAGANAVISLINGIANTIRADTPKLRSAGLNLAFAIINGMTFGLLGGIPTIENAARSVASRALNAAKNFLGINSPSKEFEKVYFGTGEGAVVGINKSTAIVVAASEQMGKQALGSMQKTLSTLGNALSDGIEFTPTITPVLDLTKVQDGFGALNNLTKQQLIAASTSSSVASSISAQRAAAATAANGSGGDTVNYTQNNYSPKSLDSATIYRQTNSQLSKKKGALTGANSG